jgi:hypothetical protein
MIAPSIHRLSPNGLSLFVRVTPNAGRDAVEGVEMRDDGQAVLRVRVKAVADATPVPYLLFMKKLEYGIRASQLGKLRKNQTHDVLCLYVGLKSHRVACCDVADGGLAKILTPAGLVLLTRIQTRSQHVKFRFTHRPLEPQQQPIIVFGWIVDPVPAGQNGPE